MTFSLVGPTFGLALCQHFGLPPDQVLKDMTLNTKENEVFSATLTVVLTGWDVKHIGRIMEDN
jgi:hypothetical protein